MRVKLKTKDLVEELRLYIANNSSLGYTATEGPSCNIFAGGGLNVDDLSRIKTLTLYDEGGTLMRGGRRYPMQERTVRFALMAGDSDEEIGSQVAVNRGHDLLEWFAQSATYFATDSFTFRLMRVESLPVVSDSSDVGTWVADFVLTFLVTQRVSG